MGLLGDPTQGGTNIRLGGVSFPTPRAQGGRVGSISFYGSQGKPQKPPSAVAALPELRDKGEQP